MRLFFLNSQVCCLFVFYGTGFEGLARGASAEGTIKTTREQIEKFFLVVQWYVAAI